MKSKWSELYYFTRKERRAIIVLVCIVLLTKIGNKWLERISVPSETLPPVVYVPQEEGYGESKRSEEKSDEEQVSVFNINEVTAEQLDSYGLRVGLARTWVNFRDAMGGFTDKEQLFQIYGIDSLWLDRHWEKMILKVEDKEEEKTSRNENNLIKRPNHQNFSSTDDSIDSGKNTAIFPARLTEDSTTTGLEDKPSQVPEKSSQQARLVLVNQEKSTGEKIEIDVNQANIYQWQMLYGIGPVLARRIVTFRDFLGGFNRVQQVAETYGLPDSTFARIRPHLKMSPMLRKIRINVIAADSLRLHPYVKWKEAGIIINYREHHGPFKNPSDLYRIRVFDTVFVNRLAPYLDFQLP